MGTVNFIPTKPGWALIYVVSEVAIPESWRNDFYDELISKDDSYRRALEDSIKTHGVRWK